MAVPKKPLGLPKAYRIKRKKIMDALIGEGESLFLYPFKLIYKEMPLPEDVPFQMAVGVSKKRFRKAVRRNRVRRLVRESFRLEQHRLPSDRQLALLIVYVGKEEEKFDFMRRRMARLLDMLTQKFKDNGQT
ncbi:MAG: ribonuclease P protein component [Chlorobi bacterium]|nr:ribonuclease P protein component [Chlorobiota bacterium]